MAVLPCPLDEPFAVLSSISGDGGNDDERLLRALKRIKNALIGNSSRKIELARQPARVAWCARVRSLSLHCES